LWYWQSGAQGMMHPDCGSNGALSMKPKYKIFLSLILVLGLGAGLVYKNLYNVKDFIVAEVKESFLTEAYIHYLRDGPSVDSDHVISTLDNGMKIVVNKYDKCVCWFIRLTGHWDSNETAAIRYLVKPGFSIIEVGANFGVHTLTMAGLVGPEGHVDAFEANPQVSRYLKQSVALNTLESKITVHEKAAGDSTGTAHLVFGIQNIGGGHLVSDPSENTVKTSIVRLDDLFTYGHTVDVLKIDAEGSEAKIIQGALRLIQANPKIIIMMEWFKSALIEQGSSPEGLLELLKKEQFKAWKIGKRQGDRPTFIPMSFDEILETAYGDFVFSRNDEL
jgi:FkbM family methyltransferase